MRRRKTAIALALCVTMLLSLVSPAAAAFPADGGRADAGGSDSTEHQWSHEDDDVKALRMVGDDLMAGDESVALSGSSYSLTAGNYYLDGDVALNYPITITGTGAVSLCLNGHTLRLAEGVTGSVITVQTYKVLNLYDCGTGGVITGGNTAGNGGGIYNNAGTLTIYGGAISGNTATSYGGGIYSLGKLSIYGGTISGNTATSYGGGICIGGTNGTLTVEGTESSPVVISHNKAGSGGGIYCFKAITIKNCTIDSNTAGSDIGGGGGIYCLHEATITDTTIQNNTTTGNGGGIYSESKLTIENSTIDRNISTKAGAAANNGSFLNGGGGICYGGDPKDAPTIKNSSITNNKAKNAYGGGIFSLNLTIESCTITGNSAAINGGGICYPGYSAGPSTFQTITLSGETTISGNTDSEGTANNLFLQSTSAFILYIREGDSMLAAGSTIGVTVPEWSTSSPLQLSAETIDGSSPVREEAAQYFYADDEENYHIGYNTDKRYLFIDKGPAPPPPHTHAESGETVTLDTPLTAVNGVPKAGDETLTAQTIHLYTTLPNRHKYSGTCYVLPEGNYYLTEDVTLKYPFVIGGDVHLCLNGHTLTYDTNARTNQLGAVIKILDGATIGTQDGPEIVDPCLTLYDCPQENGAVGKITGGVGGKRLGNTSGIDLLCDGGGVQVYDWAQATGRTATFTMYGGEISGNETTGSVGVPVGGGVSIRNGTFNLYGGKISDNRASNTSSDYTTSSLGGGVSMTGGNFTMYGGEISGNETSGDGGGVSVGHSSSFEFKGGKIIGNTAAEHGGGIYACSSITVAGGEISGNTAETGGGVYFVISYPTSRVTLSGAARITDNTAQDSASNLFLSALQNEGGILIGNDGLTKEASIGVSVQNPPEEGKVQISQKSAEITSDLVPEGSLFADDGENYHIELQENKLYLVAGGSSAPSHTHTGGDGGNVTFASLEDLDSTLAGNRVLTGDCELERTVAITGEVNLCLDGHTVTPPTDGSPAFKVPNGATLHLYGCSGKTWGVLLGGGAIEIEDGGTLVYTSNSSPSDSSAATGEKRGPCTVQADGNGGFVTQGPDAENHAGIHPDQEGVFNQKFTQAFARTLGTKTPLATGHTNPDHPELYYDLPQGNYYMTENVMLDMAMEVHDTTNFCLFGNSLTAYNSTWEYDMDHVFWVPDKAVLNVYDCESNLHIIWLYGGSVHLRGSGRVNLKGSGDRAGEEISFTTSDQSGSGTVTFKTFDKPGVVTLPANVAVTQTVNGTDSTVKTASDGTVKVTPPAGEPAVKLTPPTGSEGVQLQAPDSEPGAPLKMTVPAETVMQQVQPEAESTPVVELPRGGTVDTTGTAAAQEVAIKSAEAETRVTAPAGGEVTVAPDGTAEAPANSTIETDGFTIQSTGDTTVDPDGTVSFASGEGSEATVTTPAGNEKPSRTITIALPGGAEITPDGTVTFLSGGNTVTVTTPAGNGKPSKTIVIALPYPEFKIDDDGDLILPPGTSIDGGEPMTGDEPTVFDPETYTPPVDPNNPNNPNNPDNPDNPDNPSDPNVSTVELLTPGNGVTTEDGTKVYLVTEDTITITPPGAEDPSITVTMLDPEAAPPQVDKDGNLYVAEPVQIETDGNAPTITVEPPDGSGPVKVTPDAEVTLPGGSVVIVPQPGDWPIQILLPPDGGTIVIWPDGQIDLPPQAQVVVYDELIIIPAEGGTLDTGTGAITVKGETTPIFPVYIATPIYPHNNTSQVTYPITPSANEGGIITPNKTVRVARGGSQTFTITAEEGFVIGDVLVDGVSVGAVPSYTFQNVDMSHEIAVQFAKKGCPKDETCPIWPYTDAEPTSWYHDGVHYCIEEGLTVGTAPLLYEPDRPLTRAMLAQVLYNRSGRPAVTGYGPFWDVLPEQYYWFAITWSANAGVAQGYEDGSFRPDQPVTREQLAVMLWRYVNSPASGFTLTYSDTQDISDYAEEAVRWAVENGIINGYPDNTLAPKDSATRAEAAQMLQRYFTHE